MKSSLTSSLLSALLLGIPLVLAAERVNDQSFDQQTKAISEGLQLQQEQGVFGRAGNADMSDEGHPGRSTGDRDFDRYVERLGNQLRLYNDRAGRDPAGFQ